MSVSLTADEIAALKEGIDQGLIDVHGQSHMRADARPFVFGMDSGHSIVSSPILSVLHEKFAEQLRKNALSLMGHDAQFRYQEMRYVKFEDYRDNITAPLFIRHFDLQPSKARILMLCGMALPALLMEYFFGGHVSAVVEEKQSLSAAEEVIMQRFMGYFTDALRVAWIDIFPFQASKARLEYRLSHAATWEAQDYIAIASFELCMGGLPAQTVEILYPFQLFRSILPLLQDRGQEHREKANPDWNRALEKAVLEVPLTMTSVLTEPVVNIAWIMHMEQGTTLPIMPPHQTSLRISGKEFAIGILGSSASKAAVRISNIYDMK